jgi:hypothetical protein
VDALTVEVSRQESAVLAQQEEHRRQRGELGVSILESAHTD